MCAFWVRGEQTAEDIASCLFRLNNEFIEPLRTASLALSRKLFIQAIKVNNL